MTSVAGIAMLAVLVPVARAGEMPPATSSGAPSGPATVSFVIGKPHMNRVNGKSFIGYYDVTASWTNACEGGRLDIYRTLGEFEADPSTHTEDWNPVTESGDRATASGSETFSARPGLSFQPYLYSNCESYGRPAQTATGPAGQVPFAISDAADYGARAPGGVYSVREGGSPRCFARGHYLPVGTTIRTSQVELAPLSVHAVGAGNNLKVTYRNPIELAKRFGGGNGHLDIKLKKTGRLSIYYANDETGARSASLNLQVVSRSVANKHLYKFRRLQRCKKF